MKIQDLQRGAARTLWRIFAMPLAIAIVSIIGLVSALTGDGALDAVSWAALAVPVVVSGWAHLRRRR